MPKDYDELIPKYSQPQFVEQNLARARTMYCVDVCTEIEVFESSLTLVPSNEVSLVEEIRNKRSSAIEVTDKGELFFRTQKFREFTKDASSLLSLMSQLDESERYVLANELPVFNYETVKDILIMAEEKTRAKRDDMDVRDAHDDVRRAAVKLAKHHDELAEHCERGAQLHKDFKKSLDTLAKSLDAKNAKEEEPDGDEEMPMKGKEKEDKRTTSVLDMWSK